jgi:hypothetical protein
MFGQYGVGLAINGSGSGGFDGGTPEAASCMAAQMAQ